MDKIYLNIYYVSDTIRNVCTIARTRVSDGIKIKKRTKKRMYDCSYMRFE
jgi:hypothetical protein